jgi:hypothetical protein
VTGGRAGPRGTVFVVVVAGMALAAAIWWGWDYLLGPRSAIGEKEVYSEIQGVELEYRDKKIMTPLIVEPTDGNKVRLAGFETIDKRFPHAWVALNLDDSGRGIYMVPGDAKLVVSCAAVEELILKEQPAAPVVSFLKSECKNG